MTHSAIVRNDFKVDRKRILHLAVADFDDYLEYVTLQDSRSKYFCGCLAPSVVVDVSGTFDEEADDWDIQAQKRIIREAVSKTFGNKAEVTFEV